ncbi:MAG TPA: hypothetical protein VGD58_03830 [Herpetosiphonaceae bacterium]
MRAGLALLRQLRSQLNQNLAALRRHSRTLRRRQLSLPPAIAVSSRLTKVYRRMPDRRGIVPWAVEHSPASGIQPGIAIFPLHFST